MSQKINKFYQNYFIELALKLAKINEYKTGENPSVGCVLTDFNNEILSTGITSVDGRPHAESNALDKILKNKNNKKKRLFVTLEPCSHYGQTPPCVHLIKDKNVNEVYFSNFDKNPIVYRRGYLYLKKNKIKTLLVKRNNKFYYEYEYSLKNKIPFVSAKLAITKKFNTNVDRKKYFTNSKSLKFSHLLRYFNDSILVGKNTFLKDSPKLNCRIEGLKNYSPKIFIINKNLDIKMKNLKFNSNKINIFHSCDDKNKILKYKKYFNLIKLKANDGFIEPIEILKNIYQLGSRRLLIEGGVKTLKVFQKKKLINKNYIIKTTQDIGNSHNSAKPYIEKAFTNALDKYKVDINLDDNALFIK